MIGSRYVAGGGTENWNVSRRFVSRCGNAYVSLFLGSTIHDWTGGFRCYRRELLARMDLATVRAKGYIFQVELAGRALQLGADVKELPIRFCDRIEGRSKLGWQSIVEAIDGSTQNVSSGFTWPIRLFSTAFLRATSRRINSSYQIERRAARARSPRSFTQRLMIHTTPCE